MANSNLFRLPNELVWNVIKIMAENGDSQGLQNLCLTNHCLYSFAKTELYRNVRLTTVRKYVLLTRSIIEDPSLRDLILGADIFLRGPLKANIDGYYHLLLSWDHQVLDESRLTNTQSNLVLLCKSNCTESVSGNARCVLSLFLILLDKVKDIKLNIEFLWRPNFRVLIAGLRMLEIASKPSVSEGSKCAPLFPLMRRLTIGGDFFKINAKFIFGVLRHPLRTLFASPQLVDLVVERDPNVWPELETVTLGRTFFLTSIRLNSSIANGQGLCSLLKYCPHLLRFEGSFRCLPGSSYFPRQLDIDQVLPPSCPRLEELSLSLRGQTCFFSTPPLNWIPGPFLTCLPQMANLNVLRIDIDCFFDNPEEMEELGSLFPSRLPPRLQKLFLDATWALEGNEGRPAAEPANVEAYRRGMESIITSLCIAAGQQLTDLKTIVISSKYGTPALWTQNARERLAGSDVQAKVTGASDSRELWNIPWGEMMDD